MIARVGRSDTPTGAPNTSGAAAAAGMPAPAPSLVGAPDKIAKQSKGKSK